MTLLLGIETSTKICSVALSQDKEYIALREEGGEYSHAEKLNGFIQDIFQTTGKSLQDIDAIAVSKGPGSYTGLRIGISTAKGLCYALNKPLIAVDTLQAMALKMSTELSQKYLYAPMIDARRMEVYSAYYNSKNEQQTPISAKIIDEKSFLDELKTNKIVFFGDGASKCKQMFIENKNAIFNNGGLPSAVYVNKIAFQKFLTNDFEDVAYFEPYYLKDFIATKSKKML